MLLSDKIEDRGKDVWLALSVTRVEKSAVREFDAKEKEAREEEEVRVKRVALIPSWIDFQSEG